MIQSILFFALGALSLLLVVLLALPGFRRRSERAAQRRLEANLPLSLEEIEAGKDALRAEFAAAANRSEQEAKALRAERAEQTVAAGRALEEARAAQAQREALKAAVAALEGEREALASRLAAAEENVRSLQEQFAAQERLMDEARHEANSLEKRFEEASFLASSRQIELVGRESEAERLGDELRQERAQAAALARELNAARSAADANRGAAGEAAARSDALGSELTALEERAVRAQAEAERLRRDRDAAAAERQRLETELIEARKERVGLEVEFEGLNRLLVSLFPGAAAGGAPAKALQAAADERDRLEARAAALLRETRDLRAALALAPETPATTPEAALREQMLDLAAQVTALAIRAEGSGGPVSRALETGERSGQGDPAAPARSLAERIRALRGLDQETSSPSAR